MSKAFTSRPGITNSRGRGRGGQTRQVVAVNANRVDRPTNVMEANAGRRIGQPRAEQTRQFPPAGRARLEGGRLTNPQPAAQQSDENTEPDLERRLTYQGGYSMIAPNQRRREQINQVAQRETQAYQEHLQKNTPSSFNYVGTAGGGQLTEVASRRKLIQESPSKTQKLLKKEEKKTYFKQKEEEELQKKKDEQRKKALLNERRKKEEEEAAEHRWDNQRKVANDAFLRRLENKSKKLAGAASPIKSSQPSQNTSASERSERLQSEGAGRREAPVETDSFPTLHENLEPAEYQRLGQLAAIFPQYSESELLEILKQVDFSLDSAVAILQD